MKTLKSYVKFITEASIEPQKPLAEVWQQIYKELSPKAHKKSNMMLNWGENAKQGGKPGQLGFTLSSEANRITIWCDRKQITDIEKKVSEDFGNLTRAKSDGSTYIIYEYGKNDAATPIMFANYIINELKPEDPNKVETDQPLSKTKPDLPKEILDKPMPEVWKAMSKDLNKIGQAKQTAANIVWGEHKKPFNSQDSKGFGITMPKEANKIIISCDSQIYKGIKTIISEFPDLKIFKDEPPTKGIYAGGGKITLKYEGNDGVTPLQFITRLNNDENIKKLF